MDKLCQSSVGCVITSGNFARILRGAYFAINGTIYCEATAMFDGPENGANVAQ